MGVEPKPLSLSKLYSSSADTPAGTGASVGKKNLCLPLDAFLSLSRNGVTFGGQGSGMSYSFGIAFFTSSTSTSSPFHVSSANTISNFQNPASAGTSTLSSGTVTKSGSFTWPSQATIYIRGYIKSVNIGGIITNVSAETGTTVTATLRPPRANVNTSRHFIAQLFYLPSYSFYFLN